MIQEKLRLLQAGKLTAEQNIKGFIDKIKKEDKNINSFIEVNKNAVQEAKELDKKKKKGRLFGLAIAVKSNICVKGLLTSCASKTLSNFYAPYDADVIKKIKQEDGIIIGMTNCDEFACGSTGENSFYGPTKNPVALDRVPGGSSSGSAASVAADFCDLSLGSDTGGSIRTPASHCGIIGIKPSYGRVSRYGLIDLSMSLDQIGVFSKEVYGSALLLNIIAGRSENDPITFDNEVEDYHIEIDKVSSDLTIGISKNFNDLCQDKRILELINKKIDEFSKKYKYQRKEVDLEYVKLAVQTYYPLVYVEFFSSTRKFDGRKYGFKIEENCGEEVLRRILGGKEISKAEHKGKYYRQALATKNLIKNDFDNAFKKVDFIISPVVPKLPNKNTKKITDPKEMYAYDAFTIPSNLAGNCASVINIGRIENVPVGLQVICPSFKESLMFNILHKFEMLK